MRLIITGATGALGSAVVEAALAQDHQVVTVVRHASKTIPDEWTELAGHDLGDTSQAKAAVASAAEIMGGVDGLIHLVGAFDWMMVEQSTLEAWRTLFSINVETSVNAVQAVLPYLEDGGSIVCVGAASAQSAGPGMAPYAAAKSGVARMVEALSAELKPRRIRVNAILPGTIDTPRNRTDMPDADPSAWTSPAAIAAAILFLVSDQARAINGALLPVTNNA